MKTQQYGKWMARNGVAFKFMVGYEPLHSEGEVRQEIQSAEKAIARLQEAVQDMRELISTDDEKRTEKG